MRNYTADGELKVHSTQDTSSAAPALLASGTITTVPVSTTAVGALQAISVTSSPAGLVALQTPASGVGLTLTGAAASLIPQRFVTLTSAANLSGISFTITGTEGTEVLVGPNANTVTSVRSYSAITSIVPGGTSASTVSAGWPASTVIYAMIQALTTFSPSRKLTLTSTSDFSAVSFTFIGTDTAGLAQTETIVGPNNSTVTTTHYFASVTSITPSALAAGNISAGYPATPAVLYTVPTAGASLSHFFLKNNNAATQTTEVSLLISGVLIPFREFELQQNESGSILAYEPDLPLPGGTQVRVDTTTTLALTYLLHGTVT